MADPMPGPGSSRVFQVFRSVAVAAAMVPVVLILVSVTGSRGLMAAIGVLLAIALVRGLSAAPDGLRLTTTTVLRARVGERVTQTVTLDNTGRRDSRGCVVEISTPGLSDARLWCPPLAPGAQATCTVQRDGVARATSEASTALAVSWMNFGQRPLSNAGQVPVRTIVQPRVAPAHHLRQLSRADQPTTMRRGGIDVTGVRRWTPGDAQRAVHWRATARHGELVVAERDEPESPSVRALVVGDRFDARGEEALARLASTTVSAMQSGRSVQIGWWRPAQGVRLAPTHSVDALLDWFAAIGADVQPPGVVIPVHEPVRDLASLLQGDDPLLALGVDVSVALSSLLRSGWRPLDAFTGEAS